MLDQHDSFCAQSLAELTQAEIHIARLKTIFMAQQNLCQRMVQGLTSMANDGHQQELGAKQINTTEAMFRMFKSRFQSQLLMPHIEPAVQSMQSVDRLTKECIEANLVKVWAYTINNGEVSKDNEPGEG